VAVAEEGAFVGYERWAGVIAEGAGERDCGGRIGIGEGEVEGGEGVGVVVVFEGGGDGFDLGVVAGFVGEVVEAAAESVELGGGSATVGGEEFAGEVETFTGAG
jgi:hypothetical protein